MIQNHLTSQPLSKRLAELGVPQKSCFAWKPFYSITNDTSIDWQGTFSIQDNKNYLSNGQDVFKPWYPKMIELEKLNVSAFLSSELGELMPEQTICRRTFIQTTQSWVWEVEVIGLKESTTKPIFSSSMAEAMGLMLEHLILNGLIKL